MGRKGGKHKQSVSDGPHGMKETDTIRLEKKTLTEKYKNIKEVNTVQWDHVSSRSG